ncbi:hypothetical protein ABZ595_28185 [Streptomyces rubradiris]|uniref:hypothetical protein n=1 Tax=Streptomyces rubradiris TaxID=285531 RepID=UPI003404AECE
MDAEEEYARNREDAKVLAAVRTCVRGQVARVGVRRPKAVADAAIAERGRPDGTDVVVAWDVESAGAVARVVSSGGSWYQV